MKAHSTLFLLVGLLIAAVVSAGSAARGEWTYVSLHPAGLENSSWLLGVADGQQVGQVYPNGPVGATTAAVWSGTAGSYVNLNPPGTFPDTFSEVYAVSQGKQVGRLASGGPWHAVIWSGDANSYVNLQPPGTFGSQARGVRGNQQVGDVLETATSLGPHASLWSGTAESWVDLNPPGARSSVAYGVDGSQQVGSVTSAPFTAHGHASLWTGTGASWVDLEPAPAPGVFDIVVSVANAVQGGQQVGTITYNVLGDTHVDHAGYWIGTAGSWVDLHPDHRNVYGESRGNAVFGGYQVGQVETGFEDDSSPHAAIWHGTPESWVDLEQFLPANYSQSNAMGVWTDGHTIQVAGLAYNNTLNRTEAILWTSTVPEPTSFALLAIGLGTLLVRTCSRR
jgi:hypothetical protein